MHIQAFYKIKSFTVNYICKKMFYFYVVKKVNKSVRLQNYST